MKMRTPQRYRDYPDFPDLVNAGLKWDVACKFWSEMMGDLDRGALYWWDHLCGYAGHIGRREVEAMQPTITWPDGHKHEEKPPHIVVSATVTADRTNA